MERRSRKEILRAARLSIEAIAERVRLNQRRPGIREVAEYMITSNDRRVPAHLRYPYLNPGHPEFPEVMATVRDGAIFRLWTGAEGRLRDG